MIFFCINFRVPLFVFKFSEAQRTANSMRSRAVLVSKNCRRMDTSLSRRRTSQAHIPVSFTQQVYSFCHRMPCISAAYAVVRCPSVCPSVRQSVQVSVTFVYSVKTNKHILKLFHHLVDPPF